MNKAIDYLYAALRATGTGAQKLDIAKEGLTADSTVADFVTAIHRGGNVGTVEKAIAILAAKGVVVTMPSGNATMATPESELVVSLRAEISVLKAELAAVKDEASKASMLAAGAKAKSDEEALAAMIKIGDLETELAVLKAEHGRAGHATART